MSLQYMTGDTPNSGRITPLIDGFAYFDDLFNAIDDLESGDKLYLHNWHIDPLFFQKSDWDDTPSPFGKDAYLVEKLQSLVRNGVDVRVMIWVNTSIFNPSYPLPHKLQQTGFGLLPFSSVMSANCRTTYLWRHHALSYSLLKNEMLFSQEDTSLQDRIIINTADAFMGGCHAKFALVLKQQNNGTYTGIGYTGGIDFGLSRYGKPRHLEAHSNGMLRDYWHDIQAKIEGSEIVSDLFLFYQHLWDENIKRKNEGFNPMLSVKIAQSLVQLPAIPYAADFIPDLAFDYSEVIEEQLIQSLFTLPDIYPVFLEPEISYAPEGAFSFRESLRHAIQTADTYIYIEDQAMESLEIFDWLLEAIQSKQQLQVILLTGKTDPEDPPSDNIDKVILYDEFYSKLTALQRKRFHFHKANVYVIHSKLYLFDDKLAIIGSAGMFTRSLSEEIEHAVSYIDHDTATTNSIKTLREKLWAEHLQVSHDDFTNSYATLPLALKIWESSDNPILAPRFPIFAEQLDSFQIDSIYEPTIFFLPVIEQSGKVKRASFTEGDFTLIRGRFDNENSEQNVRFLRVIDGIYVRKQNLIPHRLAQIELAITQKATNQISYTRTFWWIDDNSLPAEDPPIVGQDFVEFDQLICQETGDPTLHESDEPLLDVMPVISDLTSHQTILAFTAGANVGQSRLLTSHVGNRITFDPLHNPVDPNNFHGYFLIPKIGIIDLEKYDTDYSILILIKIVEHKLSKEWLFHSHFNQSYTSRIASPSPVGESVAINQKVRLSLNSSAIDLIEWQYAGDDGQPSAGNGEYFEIQFSTPGQKIVHVIQQGKTYEVAVHVLQNSHPTWVQAFPTSKVTADLAESFKSKAEAFLQAMDQAGLTFTILATLRPEERAYLMATAYQISKGKNPSSISFRLDTVDISWVHYGPNGEIDLPAGRTAAQEMVQGYKIGETGAVYPSYHSEGTAMDVSVAEITTPHTMIDGKGQEVQVSSQAQLKRVARSYGVRRLRLSNHWSLSGS